MCRQDYSIDCGSPGHRGYEAFASVLLLVFPIGTPLVTGIMLWRSRDRINPPNVDSEADAIMSGDAFAIMCVRHDVFPKAVVVRDNEHAPLSLQQALKRRGVAMANRQKRASATPAIMATNKASAAAAPADAPRRSSV